MWVATLAIAGVPGFSGFFSKDEILAAAFARGQEHWLFYLLWVLGTVAAFLTAFYMARLMLYTFHGPNRTGEAEREHLHEAPWVMTGPLLVLAAGSAIGGLLNLPEVLPGAGWLEHWLAPVTSGSGLYLPEAALAHGTEWTLLLVATLLALGGLYAAWHFLKPEALTTAAEAPAETGFGLVLNRKYYIDEIYQGVIVRPLVWLSDRLLWRTVDKGVIDGAAVNGSAWALRGLGWVGSLLESGAVGWYVVVFVTGVLGLLYFVAR
jgi:NADH-quinone oxidoreductase subunit L